jgi:hypothetical protein
VTVSALRTIVIGAPSSIYGVCPVQPMLQWPMAGPDEVLDYSLDVTAQLADVGDTIAYATISVSPSGTGELAVGALNVLGNVITAWLSGGVAGRNYLVRIEITTNAARTFQWMIGLLMDPELAGYPLAVPPSLGFGPLTTWNSEAIVTPPFTLVAGNLVATGTNQATAYPIAALTDVFVSVPSGTAAILPANLISGTIKVINASSSDLPIFPPLGAQINTSGVNVPVIVSPSQLISFVTQLPASQWYAA